MKLRRACCRASAGSPADAGSRCTSVAGPGGFDVVCGGGVSSAARAILDAWSEVVPQPATVAATQRESGEVAEPRSHRYSLILCRRPSNAATAASTVITGIANASPPSAEVASVAAALKRPCAAWI